MSRKLIRVLAATVFVLAVLLLIGWRLFLSHNINRELTALRDHGLPANGDELNRWYPAVPDDQNAALVLTQAFALRRTYPDNRSNLVSKIILPRGREPLSSEQLDLLKGYVDLNSGAFAKTAEALQRPHSRYPIDCRSLMDTLLPHLAPLKNLAELHQYSAFLALHSGDTSLASSNIVLILSLAHTLDHEPALISQFVKLRLFDLAFTTLERRINSAPLTSAEIKLLTDAFVQADPGGAAVLGLIGDRAMIIPYFRMTRAEAEKRRPPKDDDASRDSPLPYNGPFILRLLGYYELDYGTYLMGMNQALAVLSNAPPKNLRATPYFSRVGEASKKRQRTLSGHVFSGYSGCAVRENKSVAHHRLALTALAFEAFRNQLGHLPENLEEVTPRFLHETLTDPFDGDPLRYQRHDGGYVMYSVGPDLSDDGGLPESEKKKSANTKSFDLPITVER